MPVFDFLLIMADSKLAAQFFLGLLGVLTDCYVLSFFNASEIDIIRLISASCPGYIVSVGVCSCFRLGGERSILLSYRRNLCMPPYRSAV